MLSLCLIKHYAIQTHEGDTDTPILTSALEGELAASHPVRLTYGKRAPGTH
jgi:hypothetical protein